MRFIFTFIAISFISTITNCQSRFTDSIIAIRVTDSLPGKPNVRFTPGYKLRASQFQNLFSGATKFYEERYHTIFKYRIVMLDSSDWVYEKLPFGFMAYDSGWIFLPAAVNITSFINIYGLERKISDLNDYLQRETISLKQLSDAVYFAYSLHELGHYFVEDNKKVIVPDMFANELIATYFSYCYLKKTKTSELQKLVNFSYFIKTNYKPQYQNIEAMDSLYTNMTMQNFKWFHCNIVLLCQQIYDKYGINFIDFYLNTFHAGVPNQFTTQQVIDLLDKKCNGIVDTWAKNLKGE